jgi:hypothetical protein
MAKLQSETITITLSRLVKNTEDSDATLLSKEALDSLEAVIGELAGGDVMVEIE